MRKWIFILFLAMLPIASHATVVSQSFSVSYTCSGSVGPFPFTFPISAPAALTVTQNGTVLATTAYTMNAVNNNYENGGSVTLNTACPSAQLLLLERVTPVTQTSVFTDNMPIPMKSFEYGLDKLTEITQEILSDFNYAYIVNLWGGGTCSGYLKSDGTCSTTPSSFNPASPGPIGGTTPSTGNFTTVAAGTTVSTIVNGTQYVGQGTNTTIQAAITAAGATGSVVIPASYAGTDTYTNPNSIQISDQREWNQPNTILQMLATSSLMDEAAGGNVQQLATCIHKFACSVVFWGDSISQGINQVEYENSYTYTVEQSLRSQFPSVVWTFLNYSIGGTDMTNALDATYNCQVSGGNTFYFGSYSGTGSFGLGSAWALWPSGCTVGQSWQWHVQQAAPDVVFLAFGQNDAAVSGMTTLLYENHLNGLVNLVQAFAKPAAVILVTNTLATQYVAPFPTYNAMQLQLQIVARDFGRQYQIPVMDAGRLYLLYRDGTDYVHSRFSLEPDWSGITAPTPTWTSIVGSGTYIGAGVVQFGSSGGLLLRQRFAQDVVFTEQISNLTVGPTSATSSVPTIQYRIDPATGNRYSLQIYICSTCNTGGTAGAVAQLFYNTTLVAQGSVTGVPNFAAFNVAVRAIGAHHQISVGGQTVIDVWDFNQLAAGNVAVGCQTFGCNIGLFRWYPGNPATFVAAQIPTTSLIGSYPSNFNTNIYSQGGDGIHHPTPLGHDAFYAASFAPILHLIQAAVGNTTTTYLPVDANGNVDVIGMFNTEGSSLAGASAGDTSLRYTNCYRSSNAGNNASYCLIKGDAASEVVVDPGGQGTLFGGMVNFNGSGNIQLQFGANFTGAYATIGRNNSTGTKTLNDPEGYGWLFSGGPTALGGHLNQSATNTFAGACTMSAGTSCTFTVLGTYTGTPICLSSVQGATLTGGVSGCALSGTTVTVTAATANSLTWGAMLVGNPN